MSVRYTSDLEITELETVPLSLSGREAIIVVQDKKTYQTTLGDLVASLSIATHPVRADWTLIQDMPAISGVTVGTFTFVNGQVLYNGEATFPGVAIPDGQIQHFVDLTLADGVNGEITLPAGDYAGVQVGIRAEFSEGSSTLIVRDGSSSGPIIDTLDSDEEEASVDAAFFFNNGTSWKTFPAPPDTLVI